MPSEIVESARHRVRVLALDTAQPIIRETRRVTAEEHLALVTLLDELHRLNVAVSDQRKFMEDAAKRKKWHTQKPVAARSQPATVRSITQQPISAPRKPGAAPDPNPPTAATRKKRGNRK